MNEEIDQGVGGTAENVSGETGGWNYNHGTEEVDNREVVDYKNEWLDNADDDVAKVDVEDKDDNKNTFYDVYKFDFKSVFEGSKLFHQEHIKKRNNN